MIIRAKISKVLSVCTFITVFGWRFCASQENNTAGNACHSCATCGAFGSCNSQESPICSCLQGFEPENRPEWYSGNWTGGCLRKVPLSCQSRNNMSREDGFLKIERIKVPGYSTRLLAPESECPRICLTNCSCLAYAHDSLLGCMFWNTTLLDIERFPTGLGSDLHFRVAYSELGHKKDLKKIIVAMVVIGLVLMSICVYFSWKWIAKERGRRRAISLDKNADASESVESSFQDELNKLNLEEFPLFEFRTLANATNGFSDATKLGKGGFGLVYKGELADGREIAVKRLSRASGQGMHEFMNEVELISKLQHRNLVRILGCCVEKNEKMLIYEYMPNKSLDFFLFDESQQILDWKKRVDIVEGICRGLLYLHRDSRLKIIHRDLKPSNILLDNNWNPKISDFGMARIFARKLDHKSTVRVVGTYGYMAPEYAIEGKFSEKSDVFSFGVMLLEIVSGRKNTGFYYHPTSANLLAHVWRLWNEGNIEASFDARILSPDNHAEIVRCVHIGLLCVQELPRDRPTISAVLSLLNSEITELPEPKQIAFASKPERTDTAGASSSQQSQRSSGSLNTVTLSILDGR